MKLIAKISPLKQANGYMIVTLFVLVLFGITSTNFGKGNATELIAQTSQIQGVALPNKLIEEMGKAYPANKTINIVFHGHSVPSGYHRTPEVRPFDSYPFLVCQGLKENYPNAVINCIVTAVGGENSIEGANRFERDVLSHYPDVIFLDYGLNDRRVKVEDAEKAYRRMITSAIKHNIPIVLLTPTGSTFAKMENPQDPLNVRADVIRNVAAQFHVPLVDVLADWKEAVSAGTEQRELLSENNHPNLRGHMIATRAILRLFQNSLR